MNIEPADEIQCLKTLYKPDSSDHKALLLVTSDPTGQNANVMPFTSWIVAPAKTGGWRISIYVFTGHHSHALIEQTGQFTVNVPPNDMNDIVKYCGSISGREVNKFEKSGLTAQASRFVAPPTITECIVHVECEKTDSAPFTMTFPGEDKRDRVMTIFGADVRAVYGREDA